MARPGRHRRQYRVREATPPRYASASPATALTGVLLDSDVIIDVLRGRAETVAELGRLAATGIPTYTCAVSVAEIFVGVRPGEETRTEAFFEARGDITLDAATGRRAGTYLSRYAASHGLEIADALIAAAAATAGLPLWTKNTRHYPMDGLRLYGPAPVTS
jgi:predicted nucleic acid-binding protein